jgi:hypothetical protein
MFTSRLTAMISGREPTALTVAPAVMVRLSKKSSIDEPATLDGGAGAPPGQVDQLTLLPLVSMVTSQLITTAPAEGGSCAEVKFAGT